MEEIHTMSGPSETGYYGGELEKTPYDKYSVPMGEREVFEMLDVIHELSKIKDSSEAEIIRRLKKNPREIYRLRDLEKDGLIRQDKNTKQWLLTDEGIAYHKKIDDKIKKLMGYKQRQISISADLQEQAYKNTIQVIPFNQQNKDNSPNASGTMIFTGLVDDNQNIINSGSMPIIASEIKKVLQENLVKKLKGKVYLNIEIDYP